MWLCSGLSFFHSGYGMTIARFILSLSFFLWFGLWHGWEAIPGSSSSSGYAHPLRVDRATASSPEFDAEQ